jgi:hypothetical protein
MAGQQPSKRRKVETKLEPKSSNPLTSLNRDISPPLPKSNVSASMKVESNNGTDAVVLTQPFSRKNTNEVEHGTGQKFKEKVSRSDTENDDETKNVTHTSMKSYEITAKPTLSQVRLLPSPIQLTRIRDLPSSNNAETVSLRDIIGDPMIKECWQFNYLVDVDFIM